MDYLEYFVCSTEVFESISQNSQTHILEIRNSTNLFLEEQNADFILSKLDGNKIFDFRGLTEGFMFDNAKWSIEIPKKKMKRLLKLSPASERFAVNEEYSTEQIEKFHNAHFITQWTPHWSLK